MIFRTAGRRRRAKQPLHQRRPEIRSNSEGVRFRPAHSGRRGPATLKACCALSVCLLAFNPAPSAVTSAPRVAPTKGVEQSLTPYLGADSLTGDFRHAPSSLPWAWQKADGPARVRTDRKVYAEPPLPARPPAGGKYVDAVFGTEVMRATDERDSPAPGCGTYYSHWPTFNADSTRLLIRCGSSGEVLIKAFDPDTFTLGRTLRRTPTLAGGVALEWQGATWSRTDPDLIFVHVNYYNAQYKATGMKLYTYRPSSNTFALLKDFAPQLSPGRPDFLFEMHVDASDEIFTFMHKRVGAGSEPLFFIIWKKSADRVLAHVPNDDYNAAVPDKTGRYIYFSVNRHTNPRKILDLQTMRFEALNWNPTDAPFSHGDSGSGTNVGRDPWTGGVSFRRLDAPHTRVQLFDMKDSRGVTDWSNDQHTSLYADDEGWALLGTYDDPGEGVGETGVYEDELMQVATDGSGRIRRLLHTRTKVDNKSDSTGYWAAPKPTISRDGRFVAYTSNWEGSGRYDLFIAKIEPAPRIPQKPADAPAGVSRPRRAKRSR